MRSEVAGRPVDVAQSWTLPYRGSGIHRRYDRQAAGPCRSPAECNSATHSKPAPRIPATSDRARRCPLVGGAKVGRPPRQRNAAAGSIKASARDPGYRRGCDGSTVAGCSRSNRQSARSGRRSSRRWPRTRRSPEVRPSRRNGSPSPSPCGSIPRGSPAAARARSRSPKIQDLLTTGSPWNSGSVRSRCRSPRQRSRRRRLHRRISRSRPLPTDRSHPPVWPRSSAHRGSTARRGRRCSARPWKNSTPRSSDRPWSVSGIRPRPEKIPP